jgi:hypothetical protein
MDSFFCNSIGKNKELNTMLMHECDIYFYEQLQDVQFSENQETYSMLCKAFACDGSGGEYVFLEDGSIGFISSEGSVGRVAENMDELLTFLLHAGCISDFDCKYLYENQTLLHTFCAAYVSKVRDDYKERNRDWDNIRGAIAEKLSLSFNPDQLAGLAMKFYEAAVREPAFSCTYPDGEKEYRCDPVLSDIIGMWVTGLLNMTEEEIKGYK